MNINSLVKILISIAIEITTVYNIKTEKTFKNELRSKDAAAKKRPNTSGVREN